MTLPGIRRSSINIDFNIGDLLMVYFYRRSFLQVPIISYVDESLGTIAL